jgi:hypothetical protein
VCWALSSAWFRRAYFGGSQGARREDSPSYLTNEQRRIPPKEAELTVQNLVPGALARVGKYIFLLVLLWRNSTQIYYDPIMIGYDFFFTRGRSGVIVRRFIMIWLWSNMISYPSRRSYWIMTLFNLVLVSFILF